MASVWTESTAGQWPGRPALRGSHATDVLVVGGGMAGVLCARKLADAGVQVTLVEARQLGTGVTANTTAKVTAQHGACYARLLAEQGPQHARQYYDANTAALTAIRAMAGVIPCDFEEKTAFLYARRSRAALEQEAEAYEALDIPYTFTESAPLPGGDAPALGMPGQGQFHPLRFLYGAAKGFTVYENTLVKDIQGHRAITDAGEIRANHIILATHYPLVNIPGLYFMKLNQQRSYVLALENAPDVNGMYIGLDTGKQSFRNYGGLLLVGGGNHTTGKAGGGYAALRKFTSAALPAAAETAAWATQDTMSLDAMPYIGQHRSGAAELLVATGFNKWGMTGSMLAALLLTARLTGQGCEYDALFNPMRDMPTGQLGKRAGESVKGYLHLSKRCSHMGCALHWNEEERSWDCPCHGSRFGEDGHVLDNPAIKDIKV